MGPARTEGSVTAAVISGTTRSVYRATAVTSPRIFEVLGDSRGVGPVAAPALGTVMVTEMI